MRTLQKQGKGEHLQQNFLIPRQIRK